jgi:hypothetical protein
LQWELPKAEENERPYFVFPEDDLMMALVDCYFDYINIFFRLLHRVLVPSVTSDDALRIRARPRVVAEYCGCIDSGVFHSCYMCYDACLVRVLFVLIVLVV